MNFSRLPEVWLLKTQFGQTASLTAATEAKTALHKLRAFAILTRVVMKSVPQVIRCAVVGATSVQLKFSDGFAATLDLLPALRGQVLAVLKRPENFQEVTLQDGTLVWPGGADICPSVLRYWCEVGRVCSQEELDAHFSAAASAEMVSMVAEAPAKFGSQR